MAWIPSSPTVIPTVGVSTTSTAATPPGAAPVDGTEGDDDGRALELDGATLGLAGSVGTADGEDPGVGVRRVGSEPTGITLGDADPATGAAGDEDPGDGVEAAGGGAATAGSSAAAATYAAAAKPATLTT